MRPQRAIILVLVLLLLGGGAYAVREGGVRDAGAARTAGRVPATPPQAQTATSPQAQTATSPQAQTATSTRMSAPHRVPVPGDERTPVRHTMSLGPAWPSAARNHAIVMPASPRATSRPTATVRPTATPHPTMTVRPSPTPHATARPTATMRASPTLHPSATPRLTATATRTRVPAPVRTATRTPVPTPVSTATATVPTGPNVPLALGPLQFSLFTVNPQFTLQQVSFTLSTAARVRVRIAPAGQVTHVRTMDMGVQPAGTVTITWNGRDNAHQRVPDGDYGYTVTATDAAGERQVATSDGLPISITYRRIVISLSQQRLTAYDGTRRILTTLVTTGNPALPTPLGHFPILGKYTPFTFVSPWPQGSPYYYAPSYTNYALLFDNRGYYVHDAPWRSNFGPGSNTQLGTPGQNYTGTHGCVNVPEDMQRQLYDWATIGTVVQVVA